MWDPPKNDLAWGEGMGGGGDCFGQLVIIIIFIWNKNKKVEKNNYVLQKKKIYKVFQM